MTNEKYSVVEVTAPVNIAVIKYWGKRDTQLNLAVNESLSLTLSSLFSRTRIQAANEDSLILNNQPAEITSRMQRIINSIRGSLSCKIEIRSENNFPTAASLLL